MSEKLTKDQLAYLREWLTAAKTETSIPASFVAPLALRALDELAAAEERGRRRGVEEIPESVKLIAAERKRQVEQEHWTPSHDDTHNDGELASAAACYALYEQRNPPKIWPWDREWWKPGTDPIRRLVKAGALIAAEIERLQRAALASRDSIHEAGSGPKVGVLTDDNATRITAPLDSAPVAAPKVPTPGIDAAWSAQAGVCGLLPATVICSECGPISGAISPAELERLAPRDSGKEG